MNFTKSLALLLVAAAAAFAPAIPLSAYAHCDTLDGPVVTEARAALEAGDVTPLLKWVRPDDEGEIRAAFDHALEVRALGEPARGLADRYFFETLIRVHRAGEGAPYTGLRPTGDAHSPESAADRALAAGTVDDLAARIAEHATVGMRERYAAVTAAQKHAGEGVEAGRAYVAAYVDYVHYVLGLHNAIEGAGGHDSPHEEH
jgi:hypothetical protein